MKVSPFIGPANVRKCSDAIRCFSADRGTLGYQLGRRCSVCLRLSTRSTNRPLLLIDVGRAGDHRQARKLLRRTETRRRRSHQRRHPPAVSSMSRSLGQGRATVSGPHRTAGRAAAKRLTRASPPGPKTRSSMRASEPGPAVADEAAAPAVTHMSPSCFSGTLRIVMDDGSQQDFSKNDVMLLPPGHDAGPWAMSLVCSSNSLGAMRSCPKGWCKSGGVYALSGEFCRFHQAATAGSLKIGSSLNGAMVSRVM